MFVAHFSDSKYSCDIFPATLPISGRFTGSSTAHSNANRVSFSTTATGNESPNLRSTHLLSSPSVSPSPPSITAFAVSITEVRSKSPVALSYLYFSGSSPERSSSITTPNANTSDSRVAIPEA
ncbi:hypothetical protein HID58_082425 [Brassica napus]|uniref:Uncharacterized protein n=1 Tax=Brassica napus TaxID=3708 RepID=A0ABQ7YBW7_BRANA|nr:hypothetical protein HID58_082425 [Brassica napus]